MEYPEALDPPKRVNPHCLDQWFAACKAVKKDDARSAWKAVFLRYVELCDSAGLLPFVDHPVATDAAIRTYLYKRRRLFIRFLEFTHLMKDIPVRRVYKEVTLDHRGFSIKVEAWIRVTDPKWFKVFRGRWAFSLNWDKERRYKVKLDPGMFVYVRNPAIRTANTWYMGYVITCPLEPDLTQGNLHDKTQYIWTHLWEPLSKAIRSRDVKMVRPI